MIQYIGIRVLPSGLSALAMFWLAAATAPAWSQAGWTTSGNYLTTQSPTNVGIGFPNPPLPLTVAGGVGIAGTVNDPNLLGFHGGSSVGSASRLYFMGGPLTGAQHYAHIEGQITNLVNGSPTSGSLIFRTRSGGAGLTGDMQDRLVLGDDGTTTINGTTFTKGSLRVNQVTGSPAIFHMEGDGSYNARGVYPGNGTAFFQSWAENGPNVPGATRPMFGFKAAGIATGDSKAGNARIFEVANEDQRILSVLGNGTVGINTIEETPFSLNVAGDVRIGRATIGSNSVNPEYGNNVGFSGTANNYTYVETGTAGSIRMDWYYGDFEFLTAPYGSAGAPLTLSRRMVLTQSGKLGIGVPGAPEAMLHVNGDFRSNGNIQIQSNQPTLNLYSSGSGTDAKSWDIHGDGNALRFRANNDANTVSNTWMQVNRTGTTVNSVEFPVPVSFASFNLTSNVNLGGANNTPGWGVNVAGASIATNGGGGLYAFGQGAPGDANFENISLTHNGTAGKLSVNEGGTGEYAPLELNVGGATRMTVHTSGKVVIGTDLPQARLHVQELLSSSQSDALMLENGTSSGHGASLLFRARDENDVPVSMAKVVGERDFNSVPGDRGGALKFYSRTATNALQLAMTLDRRGYLGINNTSPQAQLHVSGSGILTSLNVTGTGTLGTMNVTGTGTLNNLNVNGMGTLNNLNVTGTGILNSLNVNGTGTLNSLNVLGTGTLNNLNLSGTGTVNNLNVTGTETVNTLNVTGTGTIGSLKFHAQSDFGAVGFKNLSLIDYALGQYSSGSTMLNAAASAQVQISTGFNTHVSISSSGVDINKGLTVTRGVAGQEALVVDQLASGAIAQFRKNGVTKVTIKEDGEIVSTGALSVASVKTQIWTIAPDYVFEKDYKLASLMEVDAFVKKHKHLPEVPSAKEFKKKGMDLAEMNFLLLKKVEELTLHAIRQEKRDKVQEEEITGLKKTIRQLARK